MSAAGRNPGSSNAVARAVKAAIIGVLAIAGSLVVQGSATAAQRTLTTTRAHEAWYWSSNQDVRACTPSSVPGAPGLCPSGNATAAGPISPGHLGVALNHGSSDMRAYVAFDLSFIPTGSKVSSLITTFTISKSDAADADHTTQHAGQNAKPAATRTVSGTPKIRACLLTVSFGSAEGAPPQDRDPNNPTNTVATEPAARNGVDENTCSEGKSDGAVWTFDITALAAKWSDGTVFNNGFVLEPEGAAADTWTVELHGAYFANAVQNQATGGTTDEVFVDHKREVTAKVSWVPPLPPPPPPPTSGPSVPGTGSAGNGSSGSSGAGSFTPPAPGPVVPAPPLPAPSKQAIPARPVIAVSSGHPSTPWYTWVAVLFGLMGWVALMRTIGAETSQSVSNHVATMLRRRREAKTFDAGSGEF